MTELEEFYRAVLPRWGTYALFIRGTKRHVWASTIDELVAATNDRIRQHDVYFATASYAAPGDAYHGRTQDNVAHLRALRLDIDAGAKKFAAGKTPYETQRDALKALRDFIEAVPLKPGYILSSGEGLHVYYLLQDEVTPDAWLPLARQLKQACAAHNLDVDSTVTEDTARVLRPPGTTHGESGKAVTILARSRVAYTVEQVTDLLPTAAQPALPVGVDLARKYDTSVNDDVLTALPPSSVEKILPLCSAVRFAKEHPEQVAEPMWRATIGLIKHTVEGVEAAHEFSRGHPEYDADATQQKFDRWMTGPATCNEFAKNHKGCATCKYRGKISSPIGLGRMTPTEIDAVPQAKEQFEAAVERITPQTVPEKTQDEKGVSVEQPWAGHLPPDTKDRHWLVVGGANTPQLACRVPQTIVSDTGEKVQMMVVVPVSSLFWFDHWSDVNGEEQASAGFCRCQANGAVLRKQFQQGAAGNAMTMRTWLASAAVHIHPQKQSESLLMEYTRSALENLKNRVQRPKITTRFGLRIEPDGSLVCAHGRHIIYPDGSVREAAVAGSMRALATAYAIPGLPSNSSGEWDRTCWPEVKRRALLHVNLLRDMYRPEGFEVYQLAIMLGLASPLMAFVTNEFKHGEALPPNGLTVSLYSRASGRGKTTAIKAAMMAYGNPDELVRDGNKEGTTALGRIARLTVAGGMPVSFDEMGHVNEHELMSLVSAVANGAGRDRSGQGGQVLSSTKWALISLMSGNRSQRDMIAVAQEESPAVQMRLLELDISNVPNLEPQQMREFEQRFGDVKAESMGALGALIHLAICRAGAPAMNQMVSDYVAQAADLVGSDQGARFQWRALGAVLACQKILEKAGLAPFDTNVLINAFLTAYRSATEYVAKVASSSGPADLLQQFLADQMEFTVATATMRGHGTGNRDLLLSPRIPSKVYVRYVRDMRRVYFNAQAFRDWAFAHKVSPLEILAAARRGGMLVNMGGTDMGGYRARKDLLAGLDMEGITRVQVYGVNLDLLQANAPLGTGATVVEFERRVAPVQESEGAA